MMSLNETESPSQSYQTTGDMHDSVGKEMVVEVTIELYKGKPEIKLQDAGQLRRCLI